MKVFDLHITGSPIYVITGVNEDGRVHELIWAVPYDRWLYSGYE